MYVAVSAARGAANLALRLLGFPPGDLRGGARVSRLDATESGVECIREHDVK